MSEKITKEYNKVSKSLYKCIPYLIMIILDIICHFVEASQFFSALMLIHHANLKQTFPFAKSYMWLLDCFNIMNYTIMSSYSVKSRRHFSHF